MVSMKKRSDAQIDSAYHFSHRREWTEDDDRLLVEYSTTLSDEEISQRLGRTIPSIWSRRKRLRKEGELQ